MAASFDIEEKGGKSFPLISRREVESLIAEGRSIIIVSQHALKVDSWVNYHPGGDKAIAHMVGRDATDEVTVLVVIQDLPRPAIPPESRPITSGLRS